MLLIQLTQKMMNQRLMYLSKLQCTVLEVKMIDGLGMTIDVVLVNGVLNKGDTIVLCGMQGPIVTQIRNLLTPQPLKELRVKSQYMSHDKVHAAMGLKIVAPNMDHAIAGGELLVCGPRDDLDELKDVVQGDLADMMSKVCNVGVCVQASTLGSLEALLSFLETSKIPVSGVAIGPVRKRDVMQASVMIDKKRPEFAVILAFDVKVSPDASRLAIESGVTIFTADIIYHLFDRCTEHMAKIKEERRLAAAGKAIFPCILEVLPNCAFNKRTPLLLGVKVVEGIVMLDTPLCVPEREMVNIGVITSIQADHKELKTAKTGDEVCIKVETRDGKNIMFGRQFDYGHKIMSRLTRESIDLLKANFKDDLENNDWRTVLKLKQVFGII